jgi:hypothetical protein
MARTQREQAHHHAAVPTLPHSYHLLSLCALAARLPPATPSPHSHAQLHSAAAAQPFPDAGFAWAPDLSQLLVAPPAPEAAGGIPPGAGGIGGAAASAAQQQLHPPHAGAGFRFLPYLAPTALAALLAAHLDRRSVTAARAGLGAPAAGIR